MTTRAKIKAPPKDESLVDETLRFAEPRDIRFQGRHSTAVRVAVKLAASLDAGHVEVCAEVGIEQLNVDAPDDGTLGIKSVFLQRELVIVVVRKIPAKKTLSSSANLSLFSPHSRFFQSSCQIFARAHGNIGQRSIDCGIDHRLNDDAKKQILHDKAGACVLK